MHLMQLQIRAFRNLNKANIRPDAAVNLITGQNASGKTSLLEAIYYLGHLRSFRSPLFSDLIAKEHSQLELTAKIHTDQNDIPIGIRRSRQHLEVRADRQPVKRIIDIARIFPVQAIHPDSYKLITGSPSQRRQFLDWGVFHVEHGFFEVWQRYKRALSQRNAALKSRQSERYCRLWDQELIDSSEYIDSLRTNYLTQLQPCLDVMKDHFFPGQSVVMQYRRGWQENETLQDLLNEDFQKDRVKGYTRHGPHRADLIIKVDGQSAQHGISRGQQKVLVALLRLSQVQQFTQSSDRQCLLLYDDLAAELDSRHRDNILSVLSTMDIQLFLTAIEPEQINLSAWKEKKMFHVEQGQLKELI